MRGFIIICLPHDTIVRERGDQIINYEDGTPTEITVEDKTILEQVKLIQELEPEEKTVVFKMIDTFLTKKKFKDFFNKNVAAL